MELDPSIITPAEIEERRTMLADLREVEALTKTERWSARQEEAVCLVALRGGEASCFSHVFDIQLQIVQSAAIALIKEVCSVLTGQPTSYFDVLTPLTMYTTWAVHVSEVVRLEGPAGRVQATARGRGLKRALPRICAATRLYVQGSAAR